MSKIRALLFDLDGTLVDSERANVGAYARALGEVGVAITHHELAKRAAGKQWRAFLPGLLAEAAIDVDPADVARRKGEHYRQMIGELRLNDALSALAATVRPAMKTAIVTTASAENVAAILSHFAVRDSFDLVVSGNDVKRHKPDPEAYRFALDRLELTGAECLAFEDSDVGVASAAAAGIAVIRITFGGPMTPALASPQPQDAQKEAAHDALRAQDHEGDTRYDEA